MGRPAVKKAYKEAKAAEKGRQQALLEAHRKKPLMESLREHIGKLIDNIHFDPVELVAVLGLTPVVHDVILTSEKTVAKISKMVMAPVSIFGAWGASLTTEGAAHETAQKQLALTYIGQYLSVLQSWGIVPSPQQLQGLANGQPLSGGDTDLWSWLISFAIAYIIIHNAGQLVGLLDKGLSYIVPFLLGV